MARSIGEEYTPVLPCRARHVFELPASARVAPGAKRPASRAALGYLDHRFLQGWDPNVFVVSTPATHSQDVCAGVCRVLTDTASSSSPKPQNPMGAVTYGNGNRQSWWRVEGLPSALGSYKGGGPHARGPWVSGAALRGTPPACYLLRCHPPGVPSLVATLTR